MTYFVKQPQGEAPMSHVKEAALTWARSGCSVIPPAEDGTKRPLADWKNYQAAPATEAEIETWYRYPRHGVGLITGAVSGNLEMMELEGRATSSADLDHIHEVCVELGIDWLFDLLRNDGYAEWTPSGGIHFLYRIADHPVPGNTKIARRPATEEELAIDPLDRIKTLAETRGEGGYVVVAPSHGPVHKTGDSWSVVAGEIGKIPTVTWDDRCLLHKAVHAALDQMPEVETPATAPPRPRQPTDKLRPGDDYNNRTTWSDLLGPLGWTWVYRRGDKWYLRRPGKDRGTSATISATTDRLWVFSSSTEFEPEKHYSKFEAFALLEHGGNFANAARQLSALGYGEQQPERVVLGTLDIPTPLTGKPDDEMPLPVSPQASQVEPAQPSTALTNWRKAEVPEQVWRGHNFTARGAGGIFADTFHTVFKYQPTANQWWVYDGRRWMHDERAQHEQATGVMLSALGKEARRLTGLNDDKGPALRKFVTKLENAQAPTAQRWGRSDPRMAVTESDFNPTLNLVTVHNGVLDIEKQVLYPHDPQFMNTKLLEASYDPEAAAPRWNKFLDEVVPDPEVQRYLQRAVGHTLLGRAEQRALFLLHGDSGSGKSQFVKVLEQVFGDFGETAAPATFLASSRGNAITNDLNDLKGKRLVLFSELDQDEKLAEAQLKRLTGGDTAKSRGLWQENTKWKVQFTLWMATNFLPRLASDDNAIWRRVKPIHFPNVIKEHGVEEPRLAEKIFEEEASGVLNWMLEGVRMYLAEGLDDIEQVVQAVETYRDDVDVVKQFIRDATAEHLILTGDEAIGGGMPSRQLHTVYTEWSKRNNMAALGERRFSQRLSSLGFEKKRVATGIVWANVSTGNAGILGSMGGFHFSRS